LSSSAYDGLIIETEHTGFDPQRIRDFLQYLLDRRKIATTGALAPAVTPLVRVPPNGSERTQWFAKQALDSGAYGVVCPHIDTVEEARCAVAACRYPGDGPLGARGYGAATAARYFGLPPDEYYRRAGTWPHDADGELLVVIMIESRRGVEEIGRIVREVPGIGAVLIGHGDLSLSLGRRGQYDHPDVLRAQARVLDQCRSAGVACGVVVTGSDIERRIDEGYRFIVVQPEQSCHGLEAGRRMAARSLREASLG
jgi:4-hydroxy-2-oxoheptanedioate aldolase